jgi:hypothetical protein
VDPDLPLILMCQPSHQLQVPILFFVAGVALTSTNNQLGRFQSGTAEWLVYTLGMDYITTVHVIILSREQTLSGMNENTKW